MIKSKLASRTLILLTLASHLAATEAVCLDPKTWISGYKEPLTLEVRKAEAIVIGRVVSEQPLQENPDDPEGLTSYNVRVRVLVRLKGNLPNVFVIRNENTSARYLFGVGEEHLLFVARGSEGLWVNSCGNSSAMPQGKHLLKKIKAQLKTQK
jgi:hypothetical protein